MEKFALTSKQKGVVRGKLYPIYAVFFFIHMEEIEEWRAVVGFEGKYECSSLGRMRRIGGRGKAKATMNLALNTDGYPVVVISNSTPARFKSHRVHRIIAQAFLPNPENKPAVNHIDGNRANNLLSNLEWVTHSENSLHATRVLIKGQGVTNHKAKLSELQVHEIRYILKNSPKKLSRAAIARHYGVTRALITQIRDRIIWSHLTENPHPPVKVSEDLIKSLYLSANHHRSKRV